MNQCLKRVWQKTAAAVAVLYAQSLSAQVTALEYFIDTDPGPGNGTEIAFIAGDPVNEFFVADLSGLDSGIHGLYIRALGPVYGFAPVVPGDPQTLSPPSGGPLSAPVFLGTQWGQPMYFPFEVASVAEAEELFITAVEYFITTDPGFGSASALTVADPTVSVDITETLSLSGVDEGPQVVYIRAQDENGTWGPTFAQPIGVDAVAPNEVINITDIEYRIGDGSDTSQGADFTGFSSAPTVDASTTVDLSGVPIGNTQIYIRARDENGIRGQDIVFPIGVEPRGPADDFGLQAVEYSIDTEAAPGTGTAMTFPESTPAPILSAVANASIMGLANGVHHLYVRVQDENGMWGSAEAFPFVKEASKPGDPLPNITNISFDYYLDDGSYFGRRTSTLGSPGTTVDETVFPDLSAPLETNTPYGLVISVLDNNGTRSPGEWVQLYVKATFEDWLDQYFDSDEPDYAIISAKGYDAEGDGLSNFLEFVLGKHPRMHDSTGLFQPGVKNNGEDDYLTLSFPYNLNADLVSLDVPTTDTADRFSDTSTFGVLEDETEIDALTVERLYRDSEPITDQTSRTMRAEFVDLSEQ